MKFHDIVCHEDGWSHLVDGVRSASFPSWFLAVNAARRAAEQDERQGITTSVRFQAMDGKMLPVTQKAQPSSGMRFTQATPARRASDVASLSG